MDSQPIEQHIPTTLYVDFFKSKLEFGLFEFLKANNCATIRPFEKPSHLLFLFTFQQIGFTKHFIMVLLYLI